MVFAVFMQQLKSKEQVYLIYFTNSKFELEMWTYEATLILREKKLKPKINSKHGLKHKEGFLIDIFENFKCLYMKNTFVFFDHTLPVEYPSREFSIIMHYNQIIIEKNDYYKWNMKFLTSTSAHVFPSFILLTISSVLYLV